MKKAMQKLAIGASSALASLPLAASMVFAIEDIETPKGFFTDIGVLLNGLLRLIMVIGALLVFLYLILGGIEWITSGGDKGKTETARNKITAAVVGLVVLAASYAVLLIVLNFLGFSDLNQVLDSIGTK